VTALPIILVVDDDAGIQQTIGGILEDEGYQVVSAWNGQEALQHLDGGVQPVLIMLDLQMPVMDGFAFAAALDQRGLRARAPIVVLTADGRAPQKAAQVGADGYLTKPFTLLSLVDLVQRLAPASDA
jgi:two-component system, chemotaxis family, chemotaxis protein CheY